MAILNNLVTDSLKVNGTVYCKGPFIHNVHMYMDNNSTGGDYISIDVWFTFVSNRDTSYDWDSLMEFFWRNHTMFRCAVLRTDYGDTGGIEEEFRTSGVLEGDYDEGFIVSYITGSSYNQFWFRSDICENFWVSDTVK